MADNESKFVPDDVIFEILTWLPPETLLRLKTVCKLWNSTICDSKFIRKHRSNFSDPRRNKNNIGRIIKITRLIRFGSFKIYKTFVLPEHNLGATFGNSEFIDDSDGPLQMGIYGSCNGVLCYDLRSTHLMLFNPCIGRSISIPNSSSRRITYPRYFGIGYDSETNDYKIVKMTEKFSIAEVFSLKSNSWKEIKPPVGVLALDGMSIYMSGSIHWLRIPRSSKTYRILLFDVANEVFTEMELPMEIDRWCFSVASIAVANGLLSIAVLKRFPDMCEVWTMNEYGVLGSWIRRFERPVPCHKEIQSIQLTVECKIMICWYNFAETRRRRMLRPDSNKWNMEANEATLLVFDLEKPNGDYSIRLFYPYDYAAIEASLELLDYVER
ncbi:F-box protein CPR1-like [Andrographis paniculata]|uniref:F-box protein CPR1-like n=1 Tax=Andrographis paniculata TaxID=175694 RepID=UPI0021E80382|nr:F-box protein CPR1-like [Andrographis paniculata]